jgi:hypothetical protein
VPRKAHVYRIYQADDQGHVVDEGVWLDVLRIDGMTVSEPRGASSESDHLERQYVFVWGDDTIDSWPQPPRVIHQYTVTQPPDPGSGSGAPDPNAPNVVIPLLERTQLNFRGPQAEGLGGDTHATVFWVFINDGRGHRTETAIRVTNNDLNNAIPMPDVKAGDPQPPTTPSVKDGGGIAWADYAQALQAGQKDDTQFVDVLVTQRFDARLPPPSTAGQMVTYVLVQKQQGADPNPGVLDLFDPAPDSSSGSGADGGSGGGTPDAGGGGPAQGPIYRTDPLQTIVNVSWGGGSLFAAGQVTTVPGSNPQHNLEILTSKVKTKAQKAINWSQREELVVGSSVFDPRASAYGNPGADPSAGVKGTPTLLIGGNEIRFGPAGAGFVYHTFIMTSTDGGLTWTRTHDQENGFVVAMAYDPKEQAFYAQHTQIDPSTNTYSWTVLTSSDGSSWGVASSGDGANDGLYASPIITSICDPIYQDGEGNNCPGGIYGYDKKKGIVIAPYPPFPAFHYESRDYGQQIQIITKDGSGDDIKSVGGMDTVYAVAFAGGIWQAAGGSGDSTGVIAASIDDGKTWQIVHTCDAGVSLVEALSAAPKSDFGSATWAAAK